MLWYNFLNTYMITKKDISNLKTVKLPIDKRIDKKLERRLEVLKR